MLIVIDSKEIDSKFLRVQKNIEEIKITQKKNKKEIKRGEMKRKERKRGEKKRFQIKCQSSCTSLIKR